MTNRLVHETSPYLQQHASNPVNWQPWDTLALDEARQSNKPILLSIGYSACHWCHVMAHESFEDQTTAVLMNEYFINIKVDREERPDLDKIYQTAQYLLNQKSGGWPLTMFLTPQDQVPFFGGTYFPPVGRHGLPSFKDLLNHVHIVYQQQSGQIDAQNASMLKALNHIYESSDESITLTRESISMAEQQLIQAFDQEHGGFGKAPKFPHPTHLERALRSSRNRQNPKHNRLQDITLFSLEKMCRGGVFDQLGGGFFRYSVDDYWMIPHFEKMLYDNGPLIVILTYAVQQSDNALFAETILATCNWALTEMQCSDGSFYSSIDADSEGTEGKFYVWNKAEIKNLLSANEYFAVEQVYGLNREANFENRYHLHQFQTIEQTARKLNLSSTNTQQLMHSAHQKLLNARSQRVAPDCDKKALTSWNSLMIKALTLAGRTLKQSIYIDAATRCLRFLQQTMWCDNRLFATYKDGRAHLNAYLDDYAFLLDAIIEHLQTRWNLDELLFAEQLADTIISLFEDTNAGGFYFTSHDHESLIQRPKQASDEATPAGSAIAAIALIRLGYLLTEQRYITAAERAINNASSVISNNPMAHASFLNAYEEYTEASQLIILRGKSSQELYHWQQQAQQGYHPDRQVYAIPYSETETDLPAALRCKSVDDEYPVIAYICQGTNCRQSITDSKLFQQALSSKCR